MLVIIIIVIYRDATVVEDWLVTFERGNDIISGKQNTWATRKKVVIFC